MARHTSEKVWWFPVRLRFGLGNSYKFESCLNYLYVRSISWQDLNVLIAKKNLKRIGLSGYLLHLFIGLVRDTLVVLTVIRNLI